MNPVILIPARMASTRLPGKPLADIGGKRMIVRVAECAAASAAGRVVVCTDTQSVADAVAEAPDDEVLNIGVAWGRRQVEELLARGVPSLHFYVMQSAGPVRSLMKGLE